MFSHRVNRKGMIMKKIILTLLLAAFLLSACSQPDSPAPSAATQTETPPESETQTTVTAEPLVKEPEFITVQELGDYFQGLNGCAVFYSPEDSQYIRYNEELSEIPSSPCSTFKIISSLAGLEYGVIDPANSVLPWNGTTYWNADWNHDIGFEEAFQTSCIWYFRRVIDQLGPDQMQEALELLQYGNCDISDWEGTLNTNNNSMDLRGFWVESSLQISPRRQAEVMAEIFAPDSRYTKSNIELLKQVMLTEEHDNTLKIYGKTGMGVKDGKCVDAWFTGMFEYQGKTTFFSVRLDDPEQERTSSQAAKAIAIDIIHHYFGAGNEG